MTRRWLAVMGLVGMIGCSVGTDVAAPKAVPKSTATRDWAYLTDGQGFNPTVTYPRWVYGGERTTWAATASGGTPPYTFHWDATACPAPDGRNFIEVTDQPSGYTSVFEVEAAQCGDRDYYVNLLITDSSGHGVSWSHGYERDVYYMPFGSGSTCVEYPWSCPVGGGQ